MSAAAAVAGPALAAGVAAVGAAAAAAADAVAPQQGAAPQQEQQLPSFDSSRYTLHSQGAEARVWEGSFLGRSAIVKQRFSKKYRHPQLDAKLTVSRLKGEVRSMMRARKLGVHTPVLYQVDHATACIYMERIEGHSLKTLLHNDELQGAELDALLLEVGRVIARLHDGGLVHGDLTTSNMMLRGSDKQLILIDFGLSYNSVVPEDKGVDLYVLERAFASAHAERGAAMFEAVLEAYRRASKQWSATLNRFAEVRMRGRKRAMEGKMLCGAAWRASGGSLAPQTRHSACRSTSRSTSRLPPAYSARTSVAGPDLLALWEEHVATEFTEKSATAAVDTMVAHAAVNHVPVMTGGIGRDALESFYAKHFIPNMPPDVKLTPIDRGAGPSFVVDEFIFEFTHTVIMDWMLPGVKPTGCKVRVPFVVIAKFEGDKLSAERIYWDQATVLQQVGLLPADVALPITGVEQATKLECISAGKQGGPPSNALIEEAAARG